MKPMRRMGYEVSFPSFNGRTTPPGKRGLRNLHGTIPTNLQKTVFLHPKTRNLPGGVTAAWEFGAKIFNGVLDVKNSFLEVGGDSSMQIS